MFDPVYVYVPSEQQVIRISEGTGDNLDETDMANGYVDYIYYSQYSRELDFPEIDGGMILLTELFQEKYNATEDAIPAVLDMAFGDASIDYIMLY